jgi:hypothetical protein
LVLLALTMALAHLASVFLELALFIFN